MKVKALILAFVFMFAGSGLSIDIATCCSKISGFSIGVSTPAVPDAITCCPKAVPVKQKPCCEDIAVKMVINPVLGLNKTAVYNFKTVFSKWLSSPVQPKMHALLAVSVQSRSEGFDHNYPIPILKRKRVLQI